jgi:hypothetical protein
MRGCVTRECGMNGCCSPPDFPCRCTVASAASPSTSEIRDRVGAACSCFPANDRCPSGARCERDDHITLPSGMVRGDDTGKPDYTLIDLPMLERWARHMTAQVPLKGHNNWKLASTPEDEARFRQSAWRHFIAWQRGDTDEDHAAALLFNVAGCEYVRSK